MRKSLLRISVLSNTDPGNAGAASVTDQMKDITPLPVKSTGISPVSLSITPDQKRMLTISSLYGME